MFMEATSTTKAPNPYLDRLKTDLIVTPLRNPEAALEIKNNPHAVLVAAQFGGKGFSVDHSSEGFSIPTPKGGSQSGYAQAGFRRFGEFAERPLVFATTEPGNVAKAVALGCLKGVFPTSRDDTGSGMRLQTFAGAADHFLADLVHGWPGWSGAESVALIIANAFASRLMKAEQLPELTAKVDAILRAKSLDAFSDIVHAEAARADLAATFDREVFRGSQVNVVAVDETSSNGFHPPTFCGLDDDGNCLMDVCVLARRELGWVSIFAGTKEAARVSDEKGLLRIADTLNTSGLTANGQPITSWGGNFNRLGMGPARLAGEDCWKFAKDVARAITAAY